jgi:hypothetical protein
MNETGSQLAANILAGFLRIDFSPQTRTLS